MSLAEFTSYHMSLALCNLPVSHINEHAATALLAKMIDHKVHRFPSSLSYDENLLTRLNGLSSTRLKVLNSNHAEAAHAREMLELWNTLCDLTEGCESPSDIASQNTITAIRLRLRQKRILAGLSNILEKRQSIPVKINAFIE